jgi:hypothetical protein
MRLLPGVRCDRWLSQGGSPPELPGETPTSARATRRRSRPAALHLITLVGSGASPPNRHHVSALTMANSICTRKLGNAVTPTLGGPGRLIARKTARLSPAVLIGGERVEGWLSTIARSSYAPSHSATQHRAPGPRGDTRDQLVGPSCGLRRDLCRHRSAASGWTVASAGL